MALKAFARVESPVRPTSARETRPAGGAPHIHGLHDKRVEMLHAGASPRRSQPAHMRSSFNGPGFASARLDVPASPRYMQATAASRAASRPGSASAAALSVPPDVRDFSTTSTSSALPVDLSDPGPPAGGDANAEMKNLIDFGGDDLVWRHYEQARFSRDLAEI